MLLLVLRSLAVYGGTAALLLLLAHRLVFPLRVRIAVLLAAAPWLFTGQAIWTGGVYAPLDIAYQGEPLHAHRVEAGIQGTRNPLAVDVVSQMIPWRQAVREAIEERRFPLWNSHVLAGEPLLAMQQPAVFHPGTWLGLLLPLPQAWTFDMTVRLLIAALSAFLFFRGIGAGEVASLLGAFAWTFSDFLLFFVGYPVTPSVGPFPLLLLGLRRLAETGDRRAVGLTVFSLVLIVVSGHPETLLFGVAGGGIWFLFELARVGGGRRLKPLLLSLASGALALGLTAVVLLPFLEALPQTWQHTMRTLFYANTVRSEPPLESLRRFVSNVVPFAWGTLGRSRVVERLIVPAGYAGSLLFPIAAVGLAGERREKWFFALLGLLGFALHARVRGITELLTALPLFDIAVADYFIFFSVFALASLSVLGMERLRSGEGLPVFAAASVASIMALVLLAGARRPALMEIGMSANYFRLRALLQVVPLLLGLGGIVLFRRRRRAVTGLGAALLVIFTAQRGFEEADVYPTFPARAFYPRLQFLDAIPRGQPVRMAGLRWTFAPNIAALYGLEDVRGYEAMLFEPLVETYGLWCVAQPVYYNRVDDPGAPFLAFLNVRYLIAPPGYPVPSGWTLVSEERGSRLFENPKALPRVFVPRNLVWTDNPRVQVRILARIWDFANDGVGGEWRPGRLAWWRNGEAEVKVLSYTPERMALSIDAKSETVVGTSVTAWKGWKLTIDGSGAPLISFNRAFIAFRVPPGRHEAVLRYLPDGFVYGAGITLVTIGIGALLLKSSRLARQ
jgi:hypothetical protein